MEVIVNILIFIVILSIIIVVHELGHLIAAKKFHVYCSEFSIGMGPILYQKKNKETAFSIRAIPLGGFVQMAGEEGSDLENVPFERTINGIKTWQQVVVMAAGAIMNVLLAWVIFVGIVMFRGQVQVPSDPILNSIMDQSPAQAVGMQPNDKIVKMVLPSGDTIMVETFDDIVNGMSDYASGNIIFTIERNGELMDFSVEPKYNEETNSYLVGFQVAAKTRSIAWYESFVYGTKMLGEMSVQIVAAFANLIRGIGLKDVSGPVGIYQATATVASSGLISLITWIGLLSVNVGLFNLFPIPILDGGRIVIVLIEKAVGHRLSEKVQTGIMMIGLLLIAALMIFATANDILKLF